MRRGEAAIGQRVLVTKHHPFEPIYGAVSEIHHGGRTLYVRMEQRPVGLIFCEPCELVAVGGDRGR